MFEYFDEPLVYLISAMDGSPILTMRTKHFNFAEQWPNAITLECCLQNMPDPLYARKSIWLPFMKNDLQIGPDDIIIGHSSGAVR